MAANQMTEKGSSYEYGGYTLPSSSDCFPWFGCRVMSELAADKTHKTNKTSESKKLLKSKCLNERRRRDQENLYFEELAELISASITDMNSFSVKPEKCAILQESLNQIKQIKQEAGSEAVQQSQVSSSKPSVLASNVLGPLLLEALDGFMFVVNSQGKVEFVTENVTAYLKYAEDDLVGKSIYNIIHVGDHAQFSNSLLPMSLGSVVPWPSDAAAKGRTFNCRMLVKPPCEESEDVEVKQTYVSQYENMQISAILQPGEKIAETSDNTSTDGQSCLVCIARRISLSENTNTMLGIEQFTTKQDLNGKIIGHDTSGIAHNHYMCPNFNGQNLQDFCHTNDVQTLSKHIQEVLKSGNNTSSVYRFKLQDNRYVFVQTKSQLFPNRNSGEAEYVLSTHCIIRECDSDIELKGSASTSLMKSIIGQSPINNTPQRINQQPGGAIPNSISMMLGTINNYITSTNSGILAPPEENLDNIPDPFNSTNNWDNSFASVDAANSLGSNGNFPMSIVSSTTSNVNSWNNMGQIKPPTAQMPPSSQQRPMLSLQQQQMSNLLEKQRQQQQSSMNFQRQNSFESGGQKSPRFTPSPSSKVSPFQMPNQRMSTMMGYPNQRSPGSSNSMGQNRMSPAGVGYQVQRTSPLSSSHQTGNLTQSQQVYLRLQQQHAAAGLQRGQEFSTGASTMTSQPPNPLQALQCMDSRQSNLISASNHISPSPHLGGEFNFPLSTDGQMDKRSTHRAGKLSQLLTQNSSNSDFDIFSRSSSVDSNASVSVSKAGGDNFVLKSPADSGNQSPSPGPGQSPQDKPQSTTHIEDSDSKTVKEPKANNVILKQLLSQEDDVEGHDGNSAAESKEDSSIEMDKNEAEAKKTNNVLLKQLLSEDHSDHADLPEGDKCKVKQRKLSGELLHILLNEQDQNCTSAPAESTSQDTDLSSRQRHQSGPQEPQSTTMTPMTPVTPLTPLTPLTPQSLPLPPSTPTGSSQTGQPLRSQTPQQGISFSQAQSTTSSSSKGAQLGPEQHAKKLPTDTSALIKDKNLDSILNYFWEKGNEENISSKAVKRKAPPSDIDSASDAESEMLSNNNMHALSQPHSQQSHLLQKSPQYQPPQDSQQPQPQGHSRLIQKNALLAKLLSKKNAKETKIFTQLTVSQSNPCENPQQRFQKNLSERLLTVKPNTKKVEKDTSQDRKDIKLENSISGGKMDAMKDQGLSGLSQIQGINGGLNTSNSIQSGGIDSPGIQGSAANQQQFQEQYEQLQRLLSGTSSSGGQQQTITNMEVDQSTGDSSDTLLDQILQQAADLQQDINKGNIQQIGSGSATPNNNLSDDVIISQLEQVLGESEFSELESVLMNSTKSGMTDMMAIEAIQKQLMSEEPAHSVGVNGSTGQSTTAMSQSFSTQQTPGTLLQGQGFIQNTMAQQQQNQQVPKISTAMDLNFQLRQMGPPGQPQTPTLSPQQPFSQAAATNFGPQGPRLPGPQVPHGSALSGGQQRPMFSNPSSTAIQVRQSLLQQQKLKQMREVEKQRQERQRLLLQRQLNQQFNQRFPQNMENQVQSFPENLGDLMNSGSAPNVTIQRNQIPGPMSPRFAGGGLQQLLGSNNPQMSQQPNLNQLLGPSTANPGQMSPHFNQPQTPTQWARQQGSMGIPQSGGGQFNMNRHRSLSGGSIPNSGQQSRFQFPDSQFNGNQSSGSNMGMYNQQQSQQMFNQNRMMQRQISMPQGRGSPRTPQSPFGNSPDPLLMSPHSMSPNNTLRQQQQSSQVSPPFNQSSMSSAPGSFTQSVSSMPGMNSQTQSIGSQGFQGFDLQQQLSELESKKIENLGLGMAPGSTSQYVKQELRNICSARSEKQLQQHQQQAMQQQQVSQNAPVLPPQQQQQQQTETYESEIPLDIFEQINEMAKEHGVNPGHPSASLDLEDFKEEDILKQKRQEAKHIYEQFQALAKIEKPEPAEENPEVKATKLFRTQLLTPQQQQQQQQQQSMMRPGKPEAMQVQVVQKEPRSNVEEMKPHDHKNSLLQQLLSE